MDEAERQKLRNMEIRQRIPGDTLKHILGDERVVIYLVHNNVSLLRAGNKVRSGQLRRVFLDNKDGGRVLCHWVSPETKGILHHDAADEMVYGYRLKDVFNIDEAWSGDFGSHTEVYGSTSGGYVGWGGSGVGSIGGGTESHFVQHYKRLRVTVSFKGAGGNTAVDVIENDIPNADNEQVARRFWYGVKRKCGLVPEAEGTTTPKTNRKR